MNRNNIFTILLIIVASFTTVQTVAHVDGADNDLVVDAPWRTVRDYVPVMLFLPELKKNAEFVGFKVYNYNTSTGQKDLIFSDTHETDAFLCNGISFLGANGKSRNGISLDEEIKSFWHYIARVPTACLGFGSSKGKPGVHHLWTEIDWSKKIATGNTAAPYAQQAHLDNHTLRVVVSKKEFPMFGPLDQYYDVHVHTIAEQTSWSPFNLDASRKAFGGPIAMLLESAYTLGLTDTKLTNGNWSDFKNKIVTTDHNVFFSYSPYDSSASPGYGPTSRAFTDGGKGERDWYRSNFGDLGGEEVTIRGAFGVDKANPFYQQDELSDYDRQGSHLLTYGAPHFEGPWHGGYFDLKEDAWVGDVDVKPGTEGVKNPISISYALQRAGSTDGFGYASHPESSSISWSEDYYRRAIGYVYDQNYTVLERDINLLSTTFKNIPKNKYSDFRDGSVDSPIIQSNGRDFVFKGLQVWNEHEERVSKTNLNGGKIKDNKTHQFTPHKKGQSGLSFLPKPNWDKENRRVEAVYQRLMAEGLDYSFKQSPNYHFIRKLYMSAGTDAHGDFNYSLGGVATASAEFSDATFREAEHIKGSTNAFGRFRTYALTSQRFIAPAAKIPGGSCRKTFPFCDGIPDESDHSVRAYEEGNTVVTDGPIGTFSADANCRFDSQGLNYHDKECRWENYDGLIGGRGKFDGGNTMLSPQNNDNVQIKYYWEGKNHYLADSDKSNQMNLRIDQIYKKYARSKAVFTAEGRFFEHVETIGDRFTQNQGDINVNIDPLSYSNSALILSGTLRKGQTDEARFITNPIWSSPYTIDVNTQGTCPFAPGSLDVTVKFAISMDNTLPKKKSSDKPDKPPKKKSAIDLLKDRVQKTQLDTNSEVYNDSTLTGSGNRYNGLKVTIKPLDRNGKSSDLEFLISNDRSTWEPNIVTVNTQGNIPRHIENAKYTASNTMTIPCGTRWDANKHIKSNEHSSYAVVVNHALDMYRNALNPFASTFVVNKKFGKTASDYLDKKEAPNNSSSTGEQINSDSNKPPTGNSTGFGAALITNNSCTKQSINICNNNGAKCEVIVSTSKVKKDLCRWESRKSKSQCQNTLGIWTTSVSRYAIKHPQAVSSNMKGACITEVKNID